MHLLRTYFFLPETGRASLFELLRIHIHDVEYDFPARCLGKGRFEGRDLYSADEDASHEEGVGVDEDGRAS
jgi:hypothetical protein